MTLRDARALPLRDYVPLLEGTVLERTGKGTDKLTVAERQSQDEKN